MCRFIRINSEQLGTVHGQANAALKVFIDSGVIDMDKLCRRGLRRIPAGRYERYGGGRAANRRVDFVIERIDAGSK